MEDRVESDEDNCWVLVTCDDGSKVRIHCKSADVNKHCFNCKRKDKNLRMCNGCMMVSYCTPECQRAHWTAHKPKCKRLDKYGVKQVVKD